MRRIAGITIALMLAVGLGATAWFRPHLTPAERGRRLAERMGCFACHGPGGIRGAANPGREDRTVPTFEGDVMMFAKTPEQIHEWIHNGVTSKRAASRTWRADRDRGTLRMPAFKGRMGERDMDDLVAYVMAMSGTPEPDDSLAAAGLERSDSLGCVACHGPGGRLAPRNPGSLKGYVPSWEGDEFPELVRDSTEFSEWVNHGVSDRFRHNGLARFFLERAVLKMPAYERHLAPGDVEALWAYVRWLRSVRPRTHATHVEDHHD
jgi:mono/diheme cytochrome c family protein